MRISSESWLDRNKMKFNFVSTFTLRRNNKKQKKNNNLSFTFDTDFLNFVLLERELEKSLFHLRD